MMDGRCGTTDPCSLPQEQNLPLVTLDEVGLPNAKDRQDNAWKTRPATEIEPSAGRRHVF